MRKEMKVVAAFVGVALAATVAMGAAVQLDKPYDTLASGTIYHDGTSGATGFLNAVGGVSGVTGMRVMQALVQADGGDIRFFVNGATPDSGTGFVLEDTEYIELISPSQVLDFRFFATGVTVTYNLEGRR